MEITKLPTNLFTEMQYDSFIYVCVYETRISIGKKTKLNVNQNVQLSFCSVMTNDIFFYYSFKYIYLLSATLSQVLKQMDMCH